MRYLSAITFIVLFINQVKTFVINYDTIEDIEEMLVNVIEAQNMNKSEPWQRYDILDEFYEIPPKAT